ncbi:MAG: hypothetical protein ACREQ7_14605 [Candidatus Binatia bacterium]
MGKIKIGDHFPAAKLQDIDGTIVELPAAFAQAPATREAKTIIGTWGRIA